MTPSHRNLAKTNSGPAQIKIVVVVVVAVVVVVVVVV